MTQRINEKQLLIAFDHLRIMDMHKLALTDVLIGGMSSYAAEQKHELSKGTINPKVRRIELYACTCVEFVRLADG